MKSTYPQLNIELDHKVVRGLACACYKHDYSLVAFKEPCLVRDTCTKRQLSDVFPG